MNPHYLILKPSASEPESHVQHWADAATAARGAIMAASPATNVKILEPGTNHTGIILVRFAFVEDRDAFWANDATKALVAADSGLTALACTGIPYEGWPGNFVPTIATVDVPDAGEPRTYMLIEGTGTDQDRMDRYRDMILPMMRDRGAYYTVFELGGDVRVLAGAWDEGIFAVSRWPSRAAADGFWFSERYQNEAIPIRTGVGRFDVQILEGLAG